MTEKNAMGWNASSECQAALILKQSLILIIRGYNLCFSFLLGPHCRFHPTCSSYAIEALEQHGLVSGGLLALRRIMRCHPFHEGGVDPVPMKKTDASHEPH